MKNILVILALAAVIVSCKKEEAIVQEHEVQFWATPVTGGLKSVNDIICTDLQANYVRYKVDDQDLKTIPVFYLGDIPWTNSINLTEGTHQLKEFLVYNDNQTPGYESDDILVFAIPHTGSDWGEYVSTPLDWTFQVSTDLKTKVQVDVACFQPEYYENFGFAYFQLSPLIIRQQWFFGDFCIKEAGDYVGSQYTQQVNWPGSGYVDVPAIIKVEVWRNGALQQTFQNSAQGEKLSVTYGDYLNQTDVFEFKLFVLVRQGNSFVYYHFKTWNFDDVTNISQGEDGVVDFVLGNCYDPNQPPDLHLAPWMNLPSTLTYQIIAVPSTLGGYVDAVLSNFNPSGTYDMPPGTHASFCADHQTTIGIGATYPMDVYSSLYVDQLPMFARSEKWEKINWLFNHLDYFPGYHWYDIQQTLWLYDNPPWDGQPRSSVPALTVMAQEMKAQADLYGAGYEVPPGGWAAVVFVLAGTPPDAQNAVIQTMFVQVDP